MAGNSLNDPRLKLLLKSGDVTYYRNNSNEILNPILQTKGIIFPYNPTVSLGGDSTYDPMDLTHTNYSYNSWKSSRPQDVQISDAIFTAQTEKEAKYALAVIHFLRTAHKGHTGSSNFPGVSPPVLLLNYLGPTIYRNTPVIITNFVVNMDTDSNIVPVKIRGITEYIHSKITINITLRPQYSTQKQKEFSLEKFINGGYLGSQI